MHTSFCFFTCFRRYQEWDSERQDDEEEEEEREKGREERDWHFARKMPFNARFIGIPMITPSAAHLSASIGFDTPVYKRQTSLHEFFKPGGGGQNPPERQEKDPNPGSCNEENSSSPIP